MVGSLPDVITYAKFQVEIFRGYDFTGGQISHFPINFWMGLTTVGKCCNKSRHSCHVALVAVYDTV